MPPASLDLLIRDLLDEVRACEKPSGRFRPDDEVCAHDGTPLARSSADPTFFLAGTSIPEPTRRALLAANSATTPTPEGLTWREFSRARGYSEGEIARYGILLELLERCGWSFPDLAAACDEPCAYDALESPAGRSRAAGVLAETLTACCTPEALELLAARLAA